MRVFRLSDEIFDDVFEVYRYLNDTLPEELEYHFYLEGSSKVAEGSVKEGDTVLFSFKYDIVGIGVLDSGRLEADMEDYLYMFRFKPGTVKTFPLGININDLHSFLTSNGVNVGKPFVPRRDWPIIENYYTPLVVCWLKTQLCKYYDTM